MVDKVTSEMSSGGMTPEEQKAHDEKMAKVADENATSISATDNRPGREDQNADLTATTKEGDEESQVAKRPDDIPEKFWDAEKGEVNVAALLKSQQDAEAALRAKNEKPAGKSGDQTPAADDAARESVVAAASAEFAEKGELSDDTYGALEKAGLSRDMVDDYIEGQKAIVSNLQSAAFGEFDGSREAYDAAVEWAVENLSEEEIQAIDVQVTSRNPGIVKQGAAALAAKYAANADITPDTTIQGGGNNINTGAHFKSSAEMQTAMRDPRYKTDPAFRAEVSSKIANAERAGVNLFV